MVGSEGAVGVVATKGCRARRRGAGHDVTTTGACLQPWQSAHGETACCEAAGASSVQPSGQANVSAVVTTTSRHARSTVRTARTRLSIPGPGFGHGGRGGRGDC